MKVEVIQVIRRIRRIPTIEDVPKLEYTEKVFRESMRLYPPAWTIGRQVINDYQG